MSAASPNNWCRTRQQKPGWSSELILAAGLAEVMGLFLLCPQRLLGAGRGHREDHRVGAHLRLSHGVHGGRQAALHGHRRLAVGPVPALGTLLVGHGAVLAALPPAVLPVAQVGDRAAVLLLRHLVERTELVRVLGALVGVAGTVQLAELPRRPVVDLRLVPQGRYPVVQAALLLDELRFALSHNVDLCAGPGGDGRDGHAAQQSPRTARPRSSVRGVATSKVEARGLEEGVLQAPKDALVCSGRGARQLARE
mmetsp:Transcript_21133/g.71022  ORF Transcript_21133/g.71022 Transcript_21133/m.71022 type:complete len:253 (+) Transcript_21133:196-954(+)